MATRNYSIVVRDSLINPNESNKQDQAVGYFKKYRTRSNKTYYKVWIYLEGKDLPFVRRVRYKLHKTFRNRIKLIERTSTNLNCSLIIWTWGIFMINVEIEDMSGNIIRVDHYLTYGEQLKQGKIILKEESY